jgi:hypothetical protein
MGHMKPYGTSTMKRCAELDENSMTDRDLHDGDFGDRLLM